MKLSPLLSMLVFSEVLAKKNIPKSTYNHVSLVKKRNKHIYDTQHAIISTDIARNKVSQELQISLDQKGFAYLALPKALHSDYQNCLELYQKRVSDNSQMPRLDKFKVKVEFNVFLKKLEDWLEATLEPIFPHQNFTFSGLTYEQKNHDKALLHIDASAKSTDELFSRHLTIILPINGGNTILIPKDQNEKFTNSHHDYKLYDKQIGRKLRQKFHNQNPYLLKDASLSETDKPCVILWLAGTNQDPVIHSWPVKHKQNIRQLFNNGICNLTEPYQRAFIWGTVNHKDIKK